MKNHEPITVKIATEDWEFEQIHRLNYQTFVKEISQHEQNDQKKLVDRFHEENTYFIALKNQEIVGMISVRSKRPFSLDLKLSNLDQYLPHNQSVCEVRLLSVLEKYRGYVVLPKLLSALYQYCKENFFDWIIISAITQQLKLYRRLGFKPFGPLVGTEEVLFQPMILSLRDVNKEAFSLSSPTKKRLKANFLPGPVHLSEDVYQVLRSKAISHRDDPFVHDFQLVKQLLCKMVHTKNAEILLGSGTLANDVIAAQLTNLSGRGLILVNGEFGERLVNHANRFQLSHLVLATDWGKSFDHNKIMKILERYSDIAWLWVVHCETSTGMLNDISFYKRICVEYAIHLCLDCISSIGTIPVDLNGVYLASCSSGKGIRSLPGLAMVFYNHHIAPSTRLPRYSDLGLYHDHNGIPFTHSSNLVNALKQSLLNLKENPYFSHIVELSNWLKPTLINKGFKIVGYGGNLSPAVTTVQLPDHLSSREMGAALEQDGFLLSYKSNYLIHRNWIQICLIGYYKQQVLEQLVHSLEIHSTRLIQQNK